MRSKKLFEEIKNNNNMKYIDKVSYTRELFLLAIELLKENNIPINDENPFVLLKTLKETEEIKYILTALEELKNKMNSYDTINN